MAIDGNYDGKITIKKGQGISQAIRDELGLTQEECNKLGGSVWTQIFEHVKEQNNIGRIYEGGSDLNGATNKNFVVAANQVIEFSKDIWNKIVQIVNTTLGKNIDKLDDTVTHQADASVDEAPQAEQKIYSQQDRLNNTFEAEDEELLRDFIQDMNDTTKNNLDVIKEYYDKDSTLLNSIIKSDIMRNFIKNSENPNEIMDLFLKEDIIENLNVESLKQLYIYSLTFNLKDSQKKLNQLNPLNEKFTDIANLTPEVLQNATHTGLLSRSTFGGKEYYNYKNQKTYTIEGNTVKEVSSGEIKAVELLNTNLSSKAFDKWYGTDDKPNINKDNIVDVVKIFKEQNGDGIIAALDYKAFGPGVTQMRKLIDALLEKAKDLNLAESKEYLALYEYGTEITEKNTEYRYRYIGMGEDFEAGIALHIDKAMDDLIALIEKKEQ